MQICPWKSFSTFAIRWGTNSRTNRQISPQRKNRVQVWPEQGTFCERFWGSNCQWMAFIGLCPPTSPSVLTKRHKRDNTYKERGIKSLVFYRTYKKERSLEKSIHDATVEHFSGKVLWIQCCLLVSCACFVTLDFLWPPLRGKTYEMCKKCCNYSLHLKCGDIKVIFFLPLKKNLKVRYKGRTRQERCKLFFIALPCVSDFFKCNFYIRKKKIPLEM